MPVKEISISSTIREKVDWAERVYRSKGKELLRDETVRGLIRLFKKSDDAVRREMISTGIAEACRLCDQLEGGSCCGAGIENRYDGVLLLINKLLGVEIATEEVLPSSCYFLGKEGCRLKARHVICINYLCSTLTRRLEPGRLSVLREAEGREVEAIFGLHERLRLLLKGG